ASIQALVTGLAGDPFALLGPHREAHGPTSIRVFLPGVRAVAVIPNGASEVAHDLTSIHGAGLWAGELPIDPWARYRLRITGHDGRVWTADDPYRFPSTLSDYDLHLLGEGTHYRIYDKLGAHPADVDGVGGVIFAVWAPNAQRDSVVGDWNGWDGRRHPMRRHPANGIWELFIPGVGEGARYKYEILGQSGELLALKADPLAFAFEPDVPRTASVVYDLDGYGWGDGDWMAARGRSARSAPMAIYEVH